MVNCKEYFNQQTKTWITPKMLDKLIEKFHSVNEADEASEFALNNFIKEQQAAFANEKPSIPHPDAIDFAIDLFITGTAEMEKLKEKVESLYLKELGKISRSYPDIETNEELQKEFPRLVELNQNIEIFRVANDVFNAKLNFMMDVAISEQKQF